MGGWRFIKNETPALLLPWWILEKFWEHLLHRTRPGNWFNYYLKHQISEFSFPFSNFPDVYLLILVNFVVVFVLFTKWLPSYKYILTLRQFALMFVDWSSCHLAFFFGSTGRRMREKKLENSSECYNLGLRKKPN